MPNDPQVPWSDEQWARVNQVIQEEARRARVAATFLPLYGPLPADADFVRRQDISYAPRLSIDDRDTMRLATLQVQVPIRNAQMADPEMTSVLAIFRRAANVVARLEDAAVFRGLAPGGTAPQGGVVGVPGIWRITGAQEASGLWARTGPRWWVQVNESPPSLRGHAIVRAVSAAIGVLERNGHFGPFSVILGQTLFLVAQTPDVGSLVMPQDRIIPFLGGGSLLRSSTLDDLNEYSGLVVALGGAPIELVVATDMCLQFLQVTAEPVFIFRVCEKIALRIREPDAIVQLYMQ
jgi:uncharacterized linocin/CFP29 family protein